MKIEITDYLSQDEIKEIVIDEIKNQIRRKFDSEQEITRFLTNISYYEVFRKVEEDIPNYQDKIAKNVKRIISELSSYCVFRDVDEYNKTKSLGQQILENKIRDNEDLINKKIIKIFNDLSKKDIADEISEILTNYISKLFQNKD